MNARVTAIPNRPEPLMSSGYELTGGDYLCRPQKNTDGNTDWHVVDYVFKNMRVTGRAGPWIEFSNDHQQIVIENVDTTFHPANLEALHCSEPNYMIRSMDTATLEAHGEHMSAYSIEGRRIGSHKTEICLDGLAVVRIEFDTCTDFHSFGSLHVRAMEEVEKTSFDPSRTIELSDGGYGGITVEFMSGISQLTASRAVRHWGHMQEIDAMREAELQMLG